MVWKVCFDRFTLVHLVWDVWLERFGLSKDFGQKKLGGKFRWKNLVQKLLVNKWKNNWKNNLVKKKNLVKKTVVKKKLVKKTFVQKSFWSQTICQKKIVSKNIW